MHLDRFPLLAGVPGLVHALTSRHSGVSRPPYAALNLGARQGDAEDAVRENRARVAAALGFPDVLFPHQVHGSRVVRVGAPGDEPGEADGLVTDAPGRLVGVLGADCPGVLLVHPDRHALAVVHAGWRGVVAGVVDAALARLAACCGVTADGMWAGIGPGISARRYEVTTAVAASVDAALDGADASLRTASVRPGRAEHAQVDLVAALRGQLERAGVDPARIAVHGGCTFEEADRWFSHRRDGCRTGRHALVAGWSR